MPAQRSEVQHPLLVGVFLTEDHVDDLPRRDREGIVSDHKDRPRRTRDNSNRASGEKTLYHNVKRRRNFLTHGFLLPEKDLSLKARALLP